MEIQSKYIERLLKEAEISMERVNRNYYSYSDKQLNWKPAPEIWSIGEIYGHIINTNSLYYNYFEEKINSDANHMESKLLFKHTLIGKMLI